MEVRLSAGKIGDALALVKQERFFKFIVGKDAREYECSLLQACFISGKVRHLISNDSTVDSLRLLSDHPGTDFELLEKLWNGDAITINSSNVDVLSKLSKELDNEELNTFLVYYTLSQDQVSIENCISRLRLKIEMKTDFSEELAFIASNFTQFEISNLLFLKHTELEQILAQGTLQVESENSLFEFICELIRRDELYSSLLRYIRFEYLDIEHLNLFFEKVYPDHIDCILWESITTFITNTIKASPPKRRIMGSTLFEYDEEKPFNGIISHIREECGGNPHVKGVIKISASGNECNQCHQVVDYGWDDWWHSTDQSNSWIQFDFKDRSICIESYTIKSGKSTGLPSHLRHWKIEGSDDAQTWTLIDNQNNNELNGRCCVRHFTCQPEGNRTMYRYIRMTQTGPNAFNANRMWLSEIEFFGLMK